MPALRTIFPISALLLLAIPAAPIQAQQGAPLPDTVRALLTEFQQLQARLDSVQAAALEANPDLRDRRAQIESYVTEVMLEGHPTMEEKLERLPELQQELVAAQEAQDTARLRTVVQQGQRIQAELSQAQAETMQNEAVQERVTGFRRDLLAAMEGVDPAIGELVDRLETLARKLQGLQPGG